MAAMIAAITPSKTVPCRVVNSLLDVMFSTSSSLFPFLAGKHGAAHTEQGRITELSGVRDDLRRAVRDPVPPDRSVLLGLTGSRPRIVAGLPCGRVAVRN